MRRRPGPGVDGQDQCGASSEASRTVGLGTLGVHLSLDFRSPPAWLGTGRFVSSVPTARRVGPRGASVDGFVWGGNSDGPCHPAAVQETGCPMPTRVYLGTLGAEGWDPWKLTHRFIP